MENFHVYILTNKGRTVLYTGVTSSISKRLEQHRNGCADSFTKKYRVYIPVYIEPCPTAHIAISREKQLKGGSRQKKITLIEQSNPFWRDLSDSI
jgi:putative endonuclease